MSSVNQRVLTIDGAINFRDMGGYRGADDRAVRWQCLYRSAQLDQLTPKGIEQIAALNIKTVVDLRFVQEVENHPTEKRGLVHANIYDWSNTPTAKENKAEKDIRLNWRKSIRSGDADEVREAMRLNYPKKLYSHSHLYRRILNALVDSHTPLLFHCAAGKDRTGVAAALILSLLGVSERQIIDDYLLTQEQIEKHWASWMAAGAVDSGEEGKFQSLLASQDPYVIKPIFDADISYIATLFDFVHREFGDFTEYARKYLEFDQYQVERLRDLLLAPVGKISAQMIN